MNYLLLVFFSYITGIFFYKELISINILASSIFFVINLIFNYLIFYYKRINLFGISISLITLFFGAYWNNFLLPQPLDNDLAIYAPQKNITVQGYILTEPKVDENKISFELENKAYLEPKEKEISGKTIITIYDPTLSLNYGDKIQITGKLDIPEAEPNIDEFSYQAFLARKGIFTTLKVNKKTSLLVLESKAKKDLQTFIIDLKNKLLNVFFQNMPKDSASLVSSLVFGSKASPVSKEIQEDFTNLGLSHVLAASGMQISLLMTLGLLLIKKIRINNLLGISLTSIAIIFYMLLTGFPPSILRAGLVNLVILFATFRKEKTDSLKALFLVSLGLILYNPLILFDIGFEFSVLATFAILYASPLISKKLIFLPDLISEAVALIISAQLFVLPLQLFYFSQFSYLFLISNLIASLFVDFLTYLAIITISFGLVVPYLGAILGKVIFYLLSLLLFIIEYLSSLPFSVSYTSKPSISVILGVYALIFAILELSKKDSINLQALKEVKISSFAIPSVILFSLSFYQNMLDANLLKVDFINVTQGDSTFIETPQGKTFLIDCGQYIEYDIDGKKIIFDAGERYIKPYLQHKGVNAIDVLVLTHPDSDHIGGCKTILENFQVKEVWDSGQKDDSKLYSELLADILKRSIPIKLVKKDDLYTESELKLKVINDIEVNNTESKSYNNNNAIALKLDYKSQSFLFMADIEKEGEEKILESNEDIRSNLVKIGHHGSKTSSIEEFLKKVKPELAIISVGKNNRYRHPSPEVIERLDTLGIKTYRTDQDGGVRIKTNGESFNIETSK